MESPILIQKNYPTLTALCERHQVTTLYVFGSVLNERFRPDSDLDFLVTFGAVEPEAYADNYFDLRDALSPLFQRKIDLLESQTLQNPHLKHIVENSKVLVYARGQSAQMAA